MQKLSPRQKEALTWAAMGLKQDAIAYRMDIVVQTVKGLLDEVRFKLNVENTTAAAVVAAQHSIIRIPTMLRVADIHALEESVDGLEIDVLALGILADCEEAGIDNYGEIMQTMVEDLREQGQCLKK